MVRRHSKSPHTRRYDENRAAIARERRAFSAMAEPSTISDNSTVIANVVTIALTGRALLVNWPTVQYQSITGMRYEE